MERKIPFEIKTLDNMINRKICQSEKQRHDKSISHVHVSILKYLYQNRDKTVYQSDIERKIGVRRSTISGILKTMEKMDFIKRVDSDVDARKKEIFLTNKSIDKYKEMEKKVTEFETLLTNGISYEELNVFFSVIDKLKENLK